jgi:LmbE family N-acetylglucosaminyl deacetylase
MSTQTLLVILAHPDDESFGPGGTLAKYAREGVAVHYLCGTRGESGTVDAERLNGFDSVGDLRWSELTCAAKELGLAGIHHLGYRDSGMIGAADNEHNESLHAAPLDEVADRIISYIQELKPDVIITHDQFGGYGHPDHIKLHKATLRAYEKLYGIQLTPMKDGRMVAAQSAGSGSQTSPSAMAQPPRLYFSIFPKSLVKFGVKILPLFRQDPHKFGRNKDIDLAQIAEWDVPLTTRIDTKDTVEIKQRASNCHASQQPPAQASLIVRMMFRRAQGTEYFARAYPPASKGERIETNLFGDK